MRNAKAKVRRRPHDQKLDADIPRVVMSALGATPGDYVVFKEGCDRSHQDAVMQKHRRPYFIVTFEPAPVEEAETEAPAPRPTAPLESLEESVRRKREGDSAR